MRSQDSGTRHTDDGPLGPGGPGPAGGASDSGNLNVYMIGTQCSHWQVRGSSDFIRGAGVSTWPPAAAI